MKRINVAALMALCVFISMASAAAADFTLGIFGNANMDSFVDEDDVSYLQGIIDGKNEKTGLADANFDGKIDEDDAIRINEIITGEEKEVTVIDSANRTVTIKMPVDKVVIAYMGPHEPMIILAKDKIAGWEGGIPKYRGDIVEKAGLEDVPLVGEGLDGSGLDYEKILEINPDVILATSYWANEIAEKINETGPQKIPVIALDFDEAGAEDMIQEFRKLGLIVGNEEKAEEVVDWILEYEGIIEDRTKNLSASEIPTYYLEAWSKQYVTLGSNVYDGKALAGCGGRNIIDDSDFVAGSYGQYEVDPEWVLDQNPEFIFIWVKVSSDPAGFSWTEDDAKKELSEDIARPGWDRLDAVKNKRVYLYHRTMAMSPRYIVARLYFAKWLHPELFKDLDPESIHREYWKKFLNIDLTGVWAYPSPK
jgi:iron complex transport system substrate-binding protein